MRRYLPALIMAVIPLPVHATCPVYLEIDEAHSQARFELCILGFYCEDGDSHLGGNLTIDLDVRLAPSAMNLCDFEFVSTTTIEIAIIHALGSLHVTIRDATLSYPYPGVPHGPAQIEGGGTFDLHEVPAVAGGTAEYVAAGLFCEALPSPMPCEGKIDLSELGIQIIDSLPGTISVGDNLVTLEIAAEATVPFLPDNPTFAQLHLQAKIVATGVIPPPIPGEFDDDCDVDLHDYREFFACRTGPDGGIVSEGCEVFDFDKDGDIDLHDFARFQLAFTGSPAPCT